MLSVLSRIECYLNEGHEKFWSVWEIKRISHSVMHSQLYRKANHRKQIQLDRKLFFGNHMFRLFVGRRARARLSRASPSECFPAEHARRNTDLFPELSMRFRGPQAMPFRTNTAGVCRALDDSPSCYQKHRYAFAFQTPEILHGNRVSTRYCYAFHKNV